MQDFVAKYGVDAFTHLRDGDGSVSKRFGDVSRSSFVFVNDDGAAVTRGYGKIDESGLREQVQLLIDS